MTDRATAIQQAKIIQALIGMAEVSIILNNFIKAFKTKSILKSDGVWYLHGSFNLNGPKSGRMSSKSPNLMNLPSGSKYGKLIKSCFISPNNQLFVGADFNALEARISALTTKDPEKIKVYTDGFDSHCLNSYAYFKKQMPDINNTVNSINSITDKYPKLRQKSKTVTFALQYAGTWHTLVNNIGFSPEEAKQIEKSYHELYAVSDTWVKHKLEEATHTGFITGAFGLRLRTPVLQQTLLGKRSTPYKASAESRTAGNMLGQSYCLLNNRTAIEFHRRLLKSKFRNDIKPVAMIHDSCYYIVKNEVAIVEWVNRNLIECMEWQNLPEIKHPQVKLGGELEIYYPTWKNAVNIPNNANQQQILEICYESTD